MPSSPPWAEIEGIDLFVSIVGVCFLVIIKRSVCHRRHLHHIRGNICLHCLQYALRIHYRYRYRYRYLPLSLNIHTGIHEARRAEGELVHGVCDQRAHISDAIVPAL